MPGDPPKASEAAPAPKAVPTAAKSAPKPKPAVEKTVSIPDLTSPTATERRAQYQRWDERGGDETLYFGSPYQEKGVGDGYNSRAGNKFPSADGVDIPSADDVGSPQYEPSEADFPLPEPRNPPVAKGNDQVAAPPVDQKGSVYDDGMYWRTLGLGPVTRYSNFKKLIERETERIQYIW